MRNISHQHKAAQVIKANSPQVSAFDFLGTHIVLYFSNGSSTVVPQIEWANLVQQWTPEYDKRTI
tara:strand:- start:161 stop:355 length:195 start_codon:yes stop_codon:yes gene_type:complete